MYATAARVLLFFILLLGSEGALKGLKGKHLKLLLIENRTDDDSVGGGANHPPIVPLIVLGLPGGGLVTVNNFIMKMSRRKMLYNVIPQAYDVGDGICDLVSMAIEDGHVNPVNVTMNGIPTNWPVFSSERSSQCTALSAMIYSLSKKEPILETLTHLGYRGISGSIVCPTKGFCSAPLFESLDQIVEAYPNTLFVHGRSDSNLMLSRLDPNYRKTIYAGFHDKAYVGAAMSNSSSTPDEKFMAMMDTIQDMTSNYFNRRRHLKYLEVDLSKNTTNLEKALRPFIAGWVKEVHVPVRSNA
jgi:hypothetical protein